MRYYLIHPKEQSSLIFVDIRFKNKKFRYSTGILVKTISWDNAKQRLKRNQENFFQINQRLSKIQGDISSYLADIKLTQITIDMELLKINFKNIIHPELNHTTKVEKEGILSLYDNWIAAQEISGCKSISRIKRYRVTKNHLHNFIQSRYNGKDKLDTISEKYLQEFYNYLITEKELQNNTANSLLIALRMFIKDMQKDKLISSEISFELKLQKEIVKQHVVLTQDELKRLFNHKCSTEILEKAKDMFLLQMYTLQRISDFKTINSESYNQKDKTFKFYQQKTGKYIHINMPDEAVEILEKYMFKIPQLADQYYNRVLKKLFQEAGFDDKIQVITAIGAKKTKIFVPKYTKISSHTARRTGITELIRLGIPPKVIMQLSGHLNMNSLERYIKLNDSESLKLIKNSWKGRYND